MAGCRQEGRPLKKSMPNKICGYILGGGTKGATESTYPYRLMKLLLSSVLIFAIPVSTDESLKLQLYCNFNPISLMWADETVIVKSENQNSK